MDDQQAKVVDEAAQKFAEAIVLMNRKGSGRPAEAQDRLARLTRSFVERVIGNLEAQAESDRAASRRLAEQARRGQEVSRVLADQDLPEQDYRRQEADRVLTQESMDAYSHFLESMFTYHSNVETAEGNSKDS
ncbi:MAG: hypothetical protein AVDCRST_MAG28-1445 [uncultured Rubrobacteraceae bacterium]|uniref:Uncharacterized protein n=1 Tax=uncultured Rubrobacteraceae bacterium TaxID=349277 RepID=A0A6J4QRF9_9ACTN|nr:MAG: hypothetical protein AVDCRST_MAG28-1445 [uncultured Rubrobacteraceae bacterium]